MEGTVFDIKEFAVFDGPGIRTTVFLKGCPLRCRWCHNPEGLSAAPELMVSAASCVRCGACEAACPLGKENWAGRMPNPAVPPIPNGCTACGLCLARCDLGLRRIAGARWEAEKLARQLRKGEKLLRESGGGVTFSGGEPLMQWPFVRETVRLLGDLPCAVETSGYAPDEVFTDMARTMRFIMMDIKLTDAEKHRHFTGVDNEGILRHARQLAAGDTPYVLRMPLIPGVSDDIDHARNVAALARGARALVRVELLPYHRTAGAKYAMLGREYRPGFDTEAPVAARAKIFEDAGIPVRVM